MSQKYVHIILQGKGGIGKSLVASLLSQYLISRGDNVKPIDADPLNGTLFAYKGLPVKLLHLTEDGIVVERRFDDLVEQIVEDDADYVIDTGVASFMQITRYLETNDAVKKMEEFGRRVIVHTIVAGGPALDFTIKGLHALASNITFNCDMVVWLNEFFGDIQKNGTKFEEMEIFHAISKSIRGIILIPRHSSSTFGTDIATMLDNKLTFAEVERSDLFRLMARSRLHSVKETVFAQIAETINRLGEAND